MIRRRRFFSAFSLSIFALISSSLPNIIWYKYDLYAHWRMSNMMSTIFFSYMRRYGNSKRYCYWTIQKSYLLLCKNWNFQRKTLNLVWASRSAQKLQKMKQAAGVLTSVSGAAVMYLLFTATGKTEITRASLTIWLLIVVASCSSFITIMSRCTYFQFHILACVLYSFTHCSSSWHSTSSSYWVSKFHPVARGDGR